MLRLLLITLTVLMLAAFAAVVVSTKMTLGSPEMVWSTWFFGSMLVFTLAGTALAIKMEV